MDMDEAGIMGGLYGKGIIACRDAFTTAWADRLAADIWRVWERVEDRPGGALPRGAQRFYVELAPEDIAGFVDIVTHPWFVAVCEAVLTKDYRIVEVGFDIPFPGAEDQPWHRDFRAPVATLEGRRLNSLAFNLTAVDTRDEHGPFEIAPGTQWDAIEGAVDGMFPDRALWARYEERAVKKLPQRGDMSARSALTIHRGTANRSNEPRPVLVVGVDAPDATNAAHHDLQVTQSYFEGLPARVRDHLSCRVVERLEMIEQHHVIEGLL
ncbi:phytanoyl-CoA dioxygenase family protein [Sphingomonas glaciei]|uniref:Phytanoyl-CoA dioxygenase family protein n=1 Tax=Sphingomonas glaciei TaxID=2938948 RepID=A0ABY5MXP1_9SPHN|nr:phytanoyl-CoA dioxygenase family protein [Sphingomonas glaciei]UUR08254.1 phytanoyl-CoA dioxygenase family protein [Sphingomonas glaciei]